MSEDTAGAALRILVVISVGIGQNGSDKGERIENGSTLSQICRPGKLTWALSDEEGEKPSPLSLRERGRG
jgi:hypothetical protein